MLIPNQLCQVEIRLLFSWAADEVEILYMWIKFDDLIEHVNNLMKNMLWGLIRRWIYIHHCMAAGAKLTKKKSHMWAVREKHLQCVYESHQVTKLLWLQMRMMNWLMCCNVLFSCSGPLWLFPSAPGQKHLWSAYFSSSQPRHFELRPKALRGPSQP